MSQTASTPPVEPPTLPINRILDANGVFRLTQARGIQNVLPPGVYDLGVDPHGVFELHIRPGFTLPDKVYGDLDAFGSRVLKAYTTRKRGMGVLLSGPKGCGKTLTAKRISLEAIKAGIPVICVNSGFWGSSFSTFITSIPNAAIIYIDEFEKVYHETDCRNFFLGLLDGASFNQHLFLLTSNAANIGEYFNNRPGRIRYHRQYETLPMTVLMEMIADHMEEGPNRTSLETFVQEHGDISPDVLSSMIEESLIFNEPVENFLPFFNVSDEITGFFSVTIRTNSLVNNIPDSEIPEEHQDMVHDYRYAFRQVSSGETSYEQQLEDSKEIALRYLTVRRETYRARFCEPFRRRYDPTLQNRSPWINLYYAERDTDESAATPFDGPASRHDRNSNRSFGVNESQIAEMRRSGTEIFIRTKDGTEYTFTRAQTSGSSRFYGSDEY